MKRYVRVVLDAEGDKSLTMTIDLILDSRGRLLDGVPFCGWWGVLNSNDVMPFVLLADDRVDFGCVQDTDLEERFGQMGFHQIDVTQGSFVLYEDADREILYRVGPITDLMEL